MLLSVYIKMNTTIKKKNILKLKEKLFNSKQSIKIKKKMKKIVLTKRLNEDFIDILGELSDIMIRKGEPFRAKAYGNAMEEIIKYDQDILSIKQLENIKGIGKTILDKLNEYVKTGKIQLLEKEKNNPINILTKVYGIGPKKAKQFVELGIESIDDLKNNNNNEIEKMLTENIKTGLKYFDDIEKRIPRQEIEKYKLLLDEIFNESSALVNAKFDIVGSYRRGNKTSGDIDIIITNSKDDKQIFKNVIDILIKKNIIIEILSRGNVKCLTICKIPNEIPRRVDFLYSPPDEYYFALLYFTGSKVFNTLQRQKALDLGYTLNEHGLYEIHKGIKGNKVNQEFISEKSIFDFLKMDYCSPEKRNNTHCIKNKSNFTQLSELELTNIIKKANQEYYCNNKSIMTDNEYDSLIEFFKKKFPNNNIVNEGHTKCIITKNKVKLPYEMWSMDKIKPDSKALDNWISKFKGPYILSCKLDGVSGLYTTEGDVPKLYTRGNGIIGQDVSHLIPFLKLPEKKNIVLRGEFIISKKVFQEKYNNFSNPRNFVAGVINQKKNEIDKFNDIDFVIYEVIKPITCKLDGVSGLYTTEGDVPKLYTRGNGIIGQDVSHLIPFLKLPEKKNIVLRGEFIISKKVFQEKYNNFSNPRNFVAGVINQKKNEIDKFNDIDFVIYEVIKPILKPYEQMLYLKNNIKIPVNIVRHSKVSKVYNDLLSELLLAWKDNYEYEIDGVICNDNNIYERTNTNPEHAFAFKMIATEQIIETKIIDVIWNPSKDGYLKPRIKIEPIILGGTKIKYATGFNAKFIKDNNIGIGSIVKIIRSGDVIPHIIEVVKSCKSPKMPEVEYVWNSTNIDIIIKNKINDSSVQQKNIIGFFTIIGVEGLGSGNIKKIYEAGYDSVPKIIKMDINDFMKIEGFKEKLSNKIYNSIQDKIQNVSLPELMQATNIFGRGFGLKRFKIIIEAYPNVFNDFKNKNVLENLNNISGMANKTSKQFIEKIPEFLLWIKNTKLENKLNFKKKITNHTLNNKKYLLTGFRDKDLIEKLNNVGAEQLNNVSKNMDFVIVKSYDEDTTKINKAKKLNIKIITSEDLINKYF